MGVSPVKDPATAVLEPHPEPLTYSLPIRTKASHLDSRDCRDTRGQPTTNVAVAQHDETSLLPTVVRFPLTPTSRIESASAPPDTSEEEEDGDEDSRDTFSIPTNPSTLSNSPEQGLRALASRRLNRPSTSLSLASLRPFNPEVFQAHSQSASIAAPASAMAQASAVVPPAMPAWLEAAFAAAMAVVDTQTPHDNQMKILSQALPSPSASGHFSQSMVLSLRGRTAPNKVMFVSLQHAVPGRYNLSELPHTPPETPGPAVGGDNYFAATVFDSAVRSPDYEDEANMLQTRQFALAAPSSLELCILERYIPPSAVAEVATMFELHQHSLLVNRLVELSASGGCAMIVYPTKKGGEIFKRDYLSPALDATLRTITSLNEMSQSFATLIDSFPALEKLSSWEDMSAGVTKVVDELNEGTPAAVERLRGRPAGFKVEYAAAHSMSVPAKTWLEWWTKQEKQRIREAVKKYFGQRRTASSRRGSGQHQTLLPELQQSALVQEVLDGVQKRATAHKPERELEVGVFVISRRASRA